MRDESEIRKRNTFLALLIKRHEKMFKKMLKVSTTAIRSEIYFRSAIVRDFNVKNFSINFLLN